MDVWEIIVLFSWFDNLSACVSVGLLLSDVAMLSDLSNRCFPQPPLWHVIAGNWGVTNDIDDGSVPFGCFGKPWHWARMDNTRGLELHQLTGMEPLFLVLFLLCQSQKRPFTLASTLLSKQSKRGLKLDPSWNKLSFKTGLDLTYYFTK